MLALHINESRAAGSRHLTSLVGRFAPLERFIGSRHIAAQSDLHHIRETEIKENILERLHRDIGAELSLRSGSDHGDHFVAGLNMADNIHQIGLGANGAKGAGMDAMPALDTFILVDPADSELVISDRADRADTLAGTHQMGDRPVRAGICAHTAFLALGRVDLCPVVADSDRFKTAGIDAGFSHAKTAVVRHGIRRQRALFAGRLDDLNNIFGSAFRIWILRQ